MNNQLSVGAALRETIPTIFGYIGIGIAFGIVGKSSGLKDIEILSMSLITYAGSAQFIMISLLLNQTPLASIILTVFLINSRMILMSMNTSRFFKKEPLLKNILIGTFLTDESFALSMNKINYTNDSLSFEWLNTSNLIAYFTWSLASLAGGFFGNFIQDSQKLGLSFALIAMFIGLLYLQMINDRALPIKIQLLVIFFVFCLIYLGLIFIPSSFLIILVTIIGCAFGVGVKHAFV
ncbi:Azaleucine resistance protein AzlC [Oenococcus oeni]|uniref:AzlC family ABC transporter permease n=1 Tax=Oenococcus oeni TaxID=1247 RepID=UPI00107D8DF3|nr:AzlC family ABC transporter permease [Oenococcus oeni]AVI93390.1 azaleucine resistance protein AzlC [Oenococcus oeni]SYV98462.1 Azaleucine resistance protein AzlC [Oenococcus oeni]SYW02528.1 Azaleucine resistance protein AzlC [Oenococcus oeni]SYW04140.1 Azaleucine resistance protein AzlC [Oenococcus oeni]SYW18923.1 Azaleucine resistance protein AzlC [Oenococcus oeni]